MPAQKQKQEAEIAGLPGAPPEVKQPREQAHVLSDAAVDSAVIDALFDTVRGEAEREAHL